MVFVPDGDTVPMPLSMVTVFAPLTLQFRIAAPPAMMLDGAAENVCIVGLLTIFGVITTIPLVSADHCEALSFTLK